MTNEYDIRHATVTGLRTKQKYVRKVSFGAKPAKSGSKTLNHHKARQMRYVTYDADDNHRRENANHEIE